MPDGVHHVAIQCADLGASERFYRELLGLPLLRRWPGEGGSDRSVWLSLGPGEGPPFLALERGSGPARPRPFRDGEPGLHLLALRIRAGERARWEAALAAAGVEVVHRTEWTLYVRDPDGNRIGLSHHPDPADPLGPRAG